MNKNAENPKLADVPQAFEAVNKDGEKHMYYGVVDLLNVFESHVQGIAAYYNYVVLTHNNKGRSKGLIIIVNKNTKKLVNIFDTPDEHFNHPGGCQAIGDYLVVPVENSDHSESFIHFYDLSGMNDNTKPELMNYVIQRYKHGAGGAGITNYTYQSGESAYERYVLAVYDNGRIDFYLSNDEPFLGKDFEFSRVFDIKIAETDLSEICLLADSNNKLYMVGFRLDDNDDFAYLYGINLEAQQVSPIGKPRHMYTHKGGGLPGHFGVHFRWGAGLDINADGLRFRATQKLFAYGFFLTNSFQ